MTAKEMARTMVGDGQSPNKYFVTVGPWYVPQNSEEMELIPGFDENMSETVVFDDRDEAMAYYKYMELSFCYGCGQVVVEDRMVGTLCERFLHETVTYVEEEVSDMFVGL